MLKKIKSVDDLMVVIVNYCFYSFIHNMLNEIEYPFFSAPQMTTHFTHVPNNIESTRTHSPQKKQNKQTQKHITPSSHTINHYI